MHDRGKIRMIALHIEQQRSHYCTENQHRLETDYATLAEISKCHSPAPAVIVGIADYKT